MPHLKTPIQLSTATTFRYDLPLRTPLQLVTGSITRREGILLELTSTSGHQGRGEIAPLPGFHQESLAQAQQQLETFLARWLPLQITPARDALQPLLQSLEPFSLSPSLRAGVEMAILHLMADITQQPLCQMLSPSFHRTIPLQALLIGSPLDILTEAKRCIQAGYQSFKLKVGRKTPDEDANTVLALRDVIGKNASLRLDANRTWSLEDALRFGHNIQHAQIEFIEEPLQDSTHHQRFYTETKIPIALDESLATTNPKHFTPTAGVTTLVLKPSLLGGWSKTQQWLKCAQQHQLQSVISCMFESALGCAFLANLSAGIDQKNTPMGLDTGKCLANDLIPTPLARQGQIEPLHAYTQITKHLLLETCKKTKTIGT